MLFAKLFRILVLGGAMVGSASACGSLAQGQAAAEKKPDDGDKRSSADGGSAKAEDGDAGVASDAGGGVLGW